MTRDKIYKRHYVQILKLTNAIYKIDDAVYGYRGSKKKVIGNHITIC